MSSGMCKVRGNYRIASLGLMAIPAMARAQVTNAIPSKPDAASLQKKAIEAQARIHAKKDDRDQLMTAVKTNEVALAKQVLLRNGFTAEDLENAKITRSEEHTSELQSRRDLVC